MEDVTPLDELLQSMRGGEVESTGGFTLAAERARDKLRQFQLPDLHHYAVHLVAAAVAARSAWVRLEHRGSLVTFEAELPELDFASVQGLFPSLLGGGRPELQPLAIGLNAALALEPASVTVICWKGDSGAALELCPGQPDRLVKLDVCPFEGPLPPRLRVLVQARRRTWRFASREMKAVADRCAWAPLHLTGNGLPLSQSITPGRALALVTLQGAEALPNVDGRARVGRRLQDQPVSMVVALGVARGGCYVLSHGVRHSVSGFGDDVLIVAADPGTLSLSLSRELVENEALEALRKEIREAERLGLDALAHDYLKQSEPDVRALLLSRRHEDAPIFRSAQGEALSLRGLREAVEEQGAFYYTRRQEVLSLAVPRTVVRIDAACEGLLQELFPEQLSGDRFVVGNPFTASNKARWEQALVSHPLLDGQFLVQVPFEGDCPGEVGIPNSPGGNCCMVRLLHQKRELGIHSVPGLPRCLWAVAEPPGLSPNPTFDGADPQPALERLRLSLEQALPALENELLRLLQEPRPGHAAVLAALEMAGREGSTLCGEAWLPLADGERTDLLTLRAQTRSLGYLPIGDDPLEGIHVVSEGAMGGVAPLYRRALQRLFGTLAQT